MHGLAGGKQRGEQGGSVPTGILHPTDTPKSGYTCILCFVAFPPHLLLQLRAGFAQLLV
jgi:hypothetical protein